MSHLNRRRFLTATTAVAAAAGAGMALRPGTAQSAVVTPDFSSNPFKFGVAANPMGNVLWTRLGITPLAPNGRADMPSGDIPLRYKVAANKNKTGIIEQGVVNAVDFYNHSARVELSGFTLGFDREVFYWFEYQQPNGTVWSSTVGRLKTAPAPNSIPSSLNIAVISCANYEHGWFHAYRSIAQREVDLIVANGDFMYADSYHPRTGSKVRLHVPGPNCYTLADYRLRHSQYRADPDEQALRASAGLVATIDDHEVVDDWAASVHEKPEQAGPNGWWIRRQNALRAYWENMPLPQSMMPANSFMPNSYGTLRWGDLADFHLLDTRQFRSKPDIRNRDDENRYMIGPDQLAALGTSYRGARWDFIVNQVCMAQWDAPDPLDSIAEERMADAWDGYRVDRRRLVDQWSEHNVRNPVVLTGDVHLSGAQLVRRHYGGGQPVAGVELITSSVTSGGDHLGDWNGGTYGTAYEVIPDHNEDVKAFLSRRGWLNVEAFSDRLQARWYGTDVVSVSANRTERLWYSCTIPDGAKNFTNRTQELPLVWKNE